MDTIAARGGMRDDQVSYLARVVEELTVRPLWGTSTEKENLYISIASTHIYHYFFMLFLTAFY